MTHSFKRPPLFINLFPIAFDISILSLSLSRSVEKKNRRIFSNDFKMYFYFILCFFFWCPSRFCFVILKNQNIHTYITHAAEIIQCHKPIMIERRNHRCNTIIRRCKMEICHLSRYHRRNRKIIAQWDQAMETQPTEICHPINGTQRFV